MKPNWNQLAALTGALIVSAFPTRPVGELTLLNAINSALPPR